MKNKKLKSNYMILNFNLVKRQENLKSYRIKALKAKSTTKNRFRSFKRRSHGSEKIKSYYLKMMETKSQHSKNSTKWNCNWLSRKKIRSDWLNLKRNVDYLKILSKVKTRIALVCWFKHRRQRLWEMVILNPKEKWRWG